MLQHVSSTNVIKLIKTQLPNTKLSIKLKAPVLTIYFNNTEHWWIS